MKRGSTKGNHKAVIWVATISAVLLLAIIGSIFYKTDMIDSMLARQLEETPPQQSELEERQISKDEQPPAEETAPQDDKEEGESSNEEEVATAPQNVQTEPPAKEDVAAVEKPKVEQPVSKGGYIEGQQPPSEPTYINGILIANKKYPLPPTYSKGEDKQTRAAFEKMAKAARAEGIELVAFSGFRSYEYQTTLYNNYVARDGQEKADRYSARPGYSEHQTGLAFDIGEKGREDLWLTSAFGETKAGKWLVNNAHVYGFILRYPEGKEDVTGFMYESWHFRYLGVETATSVYKAGVTLEEYLEIN